MLARNLKANSVPLVCVRARVRRRCRHRAPPCQPSQRWSTRRWRQCGQEWPRFIKANTPCFKLVSWMRANDLTKMMRPPRKRGDNAARSLVTLRRSCARHGPRLLLGLPLDHQPDAGATPSVASYAVLTSPVSRLTAPIKVLLEMFSKWPLYLSRRARGQDVVGGTLPSTLSNTRRQLVAVLSRKRAPRACVQITCHVSTWSTEAPPG